MGRIEETAWGSAVKGKAFVEEQGWVAGRERWRGHVEAWQRSGLRQAAYCRREGLRQGEFSLWKGRLTGQEQAKGGFATLTLESTPPAGRDSALAIELPSGLRIAVAPGFDEQTLQRLLAALR